MPLERLLQIVMATLASLATLLLGMGERNPLLPLVAVIVAFSSIYFADVKGWIRLNTPLANLAGFLAVLISLFDYHRVDRDNQLLALANLLIYLQCVLFYRQKNPRIYWMLALLSLLQVAVATVLNLSMWFGVLLVCYLFVALAALSLFLIQREHNRYEEALQGRRQAGQHPLGPLPKGRWPLAAEMVHFSPRGETNPLPARLTWNLMLQMLRMGLATLVLAAVFFVAVPRTGGSIWGESAHSTQRTVGFTERVSLGDLGEVTQNPEEVLKYRLIDAVTNKPYSLSEAPLLQGTALWNYSRGEWWQRDTFTHTAEELPVTPIKPGMVRQEMELEALDTRTLFAVYPVYRADQSDPQRNILYDKEVDRLARNQSERHKRMRYDLLTTGLRDGVQLPLTPCMRRIDFGDWLVLLFLDDDYDLVRVKQLAEEVVKDIPANEIVLRARALERHLRDSGRYRYSLSPGKRDEKLDPIEDFLFRNPQGHCEYFASALALLCRSVNIPARMIVGFKGADFNPLDGYYHVRQLHAHTWVEVYLEREQVAKLPAAMFPAGGAPADGRPPEAWKHGGWLRLDPTPGADGVIVAPLKGRFPTIKNLLDYTGSLWSGYVLAMDAKRQREAIFNPIVQSAREIGKVLFDRESWAKTFVSLGKILRGQRPDDTGPWFSWRAALVTVVALLLLMGVYRMVRFLFRALLDRGEGRRAKPGAAGAAEVEFYRRLETLLATRNLVRPATQTQREFALVAGSLLADHPQTLPVAMLPRRIAEAFYRVRFGRLALDNLEAEAVEHALHQLASALAPEKSVRDGEKRSP